MLDRFVSVLSVSPLRFGSPLWLREPTLNSPKGQRNEFRKHQESYKSSHRAAHHGAQRGPERNADAIPCSDWPIPPLHSSKRDAHRITEADRNARGRLSRLAQTWAI